MTTEALWTAAWAERPRLLAIARRRSRNRADAEEIVSEAILRCVTSPAVRTSDFPAMLTAVTMRLCVDRLRERAVAERHAPSLFTRPADACDDILDRAEAVWLSAEVARLADRERAALTARMLGLTVAETAEALSVTYRAAEGLLGRARRKVRDVWARTLVLLWPRRKGSWFLLAAAGTLVVAAGHTDRARRPVPAVTRAQAVRTGGDERPEPVPGSVRVPPVRTSTASEAPPVSAGTPTLATPDVRIGPLRQEPVVVMLDPDPVQRVADCVRNGVYVEASADRYGVVCREGTAR